MPELPSHPDTSDAARLGPNLTASPGRSRWKLTVGITALILTLVAMVVLHLTCVLGPGEH